MYDDGKAPSCSDGSSEARLTYLKVYGGVPEEQPERKSFFSWVLKPLKKYFRYEQKGP